MVSRTQAHSQPLPWRQELRQAINSPRDLLAALDLPPDLLPGAQSGHELFRVRAPWPFVQRMRKGDPHDPLLRQVLPLELETKNPGHFLADPVGDLSSRQTPGLLHKYQGRVLLIAGGACAINCRYCFRREYPYAGNSAVSDHFASALRYIAEHNDVHEVILSGGDPLLLATARLREFTDALLAIPHIRRLRLHSRIPIVLPSRITDNFVAWIKELAWPVTLVLHGNHANEVDEAVIQGLNRLRQAGAILLNQAVLLRGINDHATHQAALAETLFDAGVLPYYLHLLDQVRGSAHFEVSASEASALMQQLRRQLPGYLVPRLVREEAGAPYKIPLL